MEKIREPLRGHPSVCGQERGSGGSATQLAFSGLLQSKHPDRRCAGGRSCNATAHFTAGETQVQRAEVTCSRPHPVS